MKHGYAREGMTDLTPYTQTPAPQTWVRPAEWLALPTVTNTDHRFVALYAISPTTTNVAVLCQGAYTVDWGDGTSTNHATNTRAEKVYTWSSIPAGTQMADGRRQVIISITPQAGQSLTFVDLKQKVQTAVTGIPDGFNAPCLDIVASLPAATALSLGQGNGTPAVFFYQLQRFRLLGSNSITSFATLFGQCRSLQVVQIDTTTAASSVANMFLNCTALVDAPALNTANVTDFTSMFSGCTALRTCPAYDTGKATSMASMFNTCSVLTALPPLNTSLVTSFSSFAAGCRNIRSVPAYDFSRATDASAAFLNCSGVTSFPAFDLPVCTNVSQMFSGCTAMTSWPTLTNTGLVTNWQSTFNACSNTAGVPPLYNMAGATNVPSMFNGCIRLTGIPAFNLANVSSAASMFSGCPGLVSVPALDLSKVTTMANMFDGCNSLVTVGTLTTTPLLNNLTQTFRNCWVLSAIPVMNYNAVTTLASTFQNCYALISAVITTTGACTDFTNMFSNCVNLETVELNMVNAATAMGTTASAVVSCWNIKSFKANGLRIAIGLSNPNKMDAAALDAFYTSLGTASGAQTITVTGSAGTATDTPTIATAKGWTVTGS